MGSNRLCSILVGFAAVAVLAADASAMYHPTLGRFMQRDPGPEDAVRIGAGGSVANGRFLPHDPTGQYVDGMALYQYATANPGRYLDPSGTQASQQPIFDSQGRVVGRRDPACINCLGYAMGEDVTIQPRGTHGSLAALLDARGWKCTRMPPYEDCVCPENHLRLVVVVYSHPFMNADGTMRSEPDGWIPDPFFDPFPSQEMYPGSDYHAYRGPEGSTAGTWGSHVGGNLPKREAPRPREDVSPDEVHGREGGFPPNLPRLCCCKCKYENDASP